MSDTKQHYAKLLGSVYRWFVSAAGDPVARARGFIARYELARGATCLDLGAGFGQHTLALLEAGKRVTAVDFDPTLLAELRAAAAAAPDAARLEVREADLLDFLRTAGDTRWDTILCLGDTLTHLPTMAAAETLILECARHLDPAGRLALSYRDSTAFTATGSARFREVARDSTRTMHCLLEPVDDEHLRVTDLVTELHPDGPRTRISDYVKLRIAPARLLAWAAAAGLALERQGEEAGMLTLVFAPGTAR
jgi:2-polyprenyl-3-methyl-5-hydroxy-6-metoxy-1,4-benzoquinol methylase